MLMLGEQDWQEFNIHNESIMLTTFTEENSFPSRVEEHAHWAFNTKLTKDEHIRNYNQGSQQQQLWPQIQIKTK